MPWRYRLVKELYSKLSQKPPTFTNEDFIGKDIVHLPEADYDVECLELIVDLMRRSKDK